MEHSKDDGAGGEGDSTGGDDGDHANGDIRRTAILMVERTSKYCYPWWPRTK